jgi:Domain of unknown function (DUF4136)
MKMKYALCAMFACLASAIASGQTVSVNYNKTQDFSQYHTYIWASNNANQIQNSILAQQAKSDIDTALQGKGLQLVTESQNPDLIILASGGMQQQTSYSAMGMRGFGGGMGTITPEQNVIGTLIVDVYGAKDKNLLWRGLAQNTLSTNGSKNSQMVSKAVVKMFKQYP